jgi:hypothetical protein
VRLAPIVLLVAVAGGCVHGGQIQNLPLHWVGAGNSPKASPAVAESFAAAPIRFSLRDVRPDPSAVGSYQDDGFIVRTSDDVAAYSGSRVGEMLAKAGARLNEQPISTVDIELLEYQVVEGGAFNGSVRMRAIVSHGGGGPWAKIYEGKSKRWGRTHNPDNFNEALSNALEDATKQMLQDDGFAHALVAGAPPPGP